MQTRQKTTNGKRKRSESPMEHQDRSVPQQMLSAQPNSSPSCTQQEPSVSHTNGEEHIVCRRQIAELETALSNANEHIKALTAQACPANSSYMDDEDIDKQLVQANTELSQCFRRISALKIQRGNRQAYTSSTMAPKTNYHVGNGNSTAAKQCTQGK